MASEPLIVPVALPEPQVTLKETVQVLGRGVHTGEECRLRIEPAEAESGIVFTDGAHRFVLSAARWVPTDRCTAVGVDGFRVLTVEHMLAAIFGVGIDNATVVVEGPEVPILDGSAKPWVDMLITSGTREHAERAVAYELREPVAVECGASRVEAVPQGALTLTVTTDYGHPMLGAQTFAAVMDRETFVGEIAPARTFALAEEVERVLASGLARGADLSNTLVVYKDHYSDALRVDNECLKHKVLDVFGDLCVLGRRLHAGITAYKPGHAVNARLVQRLAHALDGGPLS